MRGAFPLEVEVRSSVHSSLRPTMPLPLQLSSFFVPAALLCSLLRAGDAAWAADASAGPFPDSLVLPNPARGISEVRLTALDAVARTASGRVVVNRAVAEAISTEEVQRALRDKRPELLRDVTLVKTRYTGAKVQVKEVRLLRADGPRRMKFDVVGFVDADEDERVFEGLSYSWQPRGRKPVADFTVHGHLDFALVPNEALTARPLRVSVASNTIDVELRVSLASGLRASFAYARPVSEQRPELVPSLRANELPFLARMRLDDLRIHDVLEDRLILDVAIGPLGPTPASE